MGVGRIGDVFAIVGDFRRRDFRRLGEAGGVEGFGLSEDAGGVYAAVFAGGHAGGEGEHLPGLGGYEEVGRYAAEHEGAPIRREEGAEELPLRLFCAAERGQSEGGRAGVAHGVGSGASAASPAAIVSAAAFIAAPPTSALARSLAAVVIAAPAASALVAASSAALLFEAWAAGFAGAPDVTGPRVPAAPAFGRGRAVGGRRGLVGERGAVRLLGEGEAAVAPRPAVAGLPVRRDVGVERFEGALKIEAARGMEVGNPFHILIALREGVDIRKDRDDLGEGLAAAVLGLDVVPFQRQVDLEVDARHGFV